MGYLVHILIALAAQGAAEVGLESGARLALVVPLLAFVPPVLGALARRAALRGRFRLAGLVTRALALSPALLHLAALALCGWRLSVSAWLGLDVSLFEWPTLGLLLVLAPFALYTLAAIDAQARLNAERAPVRRSLRRFQARMFLSGLLPVAGYICGASALGLFPELRLNVEEVALWNALFSLAFFGALALCLPWILRNTWDTAPIEPGGARMLLERVAELAGFRCQDLYVWRTGNLMANAAVIGVGPWSRIVLFSDSLLAQLAPRELAAVFAHEIGHARRHHVLIFLCFAAGFFMAADLVAGAFDPGGELVGLSVMGAALAFWFVGFGWLSRRFELDADLFSLGLIGDPMALTSALEAVGGHLRDVASWRHFSVAERAVFLRRAASERGFARAFRRRLSAFVWLGVALFAVAAVLQARDVLAGFASERVVVELRLGRYAAAAERLAGVAAADEDLARIVARARDARLGDFEGPAPAARECRARARHEIAADRAQEAWDWLRLARLAGEREAEVLAEGLELADEGEVDAARERFESAGAREYLDWLARRGR